MTRGVVNQEPRLFTTGTEETKPVSKRGMQERLRRRTERELFLELSRYYPLAVGLWTCPRLLCEGKHRRGQCTNNIPLTHCFISGERFRDSAYSPANRSQSVGIVGCELAVNSLQ